MYTPFLIAEKREDAQADVDDEAAALKSECIRRFPGEQQ